MRIPTQNVHQHREQLHNFVRSLVDSNPAQALQAMNQIQGAPSFDQLVRSGSAPPSHAIPACGCMPPPAVGLSGAPAGKGLATNEPGWPSGTVTTAGGYRVVPEGSQAAWSIYAPGQNPGEKPHTRVWGDPHVDEKDGTRWDFTKNSDFALPDGTRINVETTSEHGQSVSAALNIVNGADRVRIDGINGRPQTGSVSQDGYEWRANHISSNPGRDTFHLGGDKDNVHWSRERDGHIDGVVTGAHFDKAQNRYEQNIDPTLQARVDPSLRPPFGSRAWGNMIRSETNDAFAKLGLGPHASHQFAQHMHMDHLQGQFQADMRALFSRQFDQLTMLMDLMQSESRWQQQLQGMQYTNLPGR